MNALVSVLEIAVYVLTVVAVVGILAAYALVTWGFFLFRRWAHGLVDKLVAASATSGVPLRQAPPAPAPAEPRRRPTRWDLERVSDDSSDEDAHVLPTVERGSHDRTRDCLCSPRLLCRSCQEATCVHLGVGRLVVHNEAS